MRLQTEYTRLLSVITSKITNGYASINDNTITRGAVLKAASTFPLNKYAHACVKPQKGHCIPKIYLNGQKKYGICPSKHIAATIQKKTNVPIINMEM